MLQQNDAEMVKGVERDLNELLGVNGKPLFVELARWNNSMPQYAVGHLERVAQIEKEVNKLTGLALAGNAYSGAGIPDCIRSGQKAAEILINSGQ
jgi:oxygen-dependent protoporphyrinogen oxidase